MRSPRIPCFALAFASLIAGTAFNQVRAAAPGEVELARKGDTLEVTIGGQPFSTYHFAKDLAKPYFSPIRVPGGTIITRPIIKKGDHPHHKGIWFSVDEVNRVDFWGEKGIIQNVSVEPIVEKGNPARFKVVNHWLGKDGHPVLIETTTIGIHANRLVEYDAVLTAAEKPVTFGDTKEGLFGFRMVGSMRESAGGKVVNAEGALGTAKCWGQPSKWVDYYGPVDGKTLGVAIFDNPHNFRHSRYHVRDYGLFSISPFGEKSYTGGKHPAAPVELKAGANLRLRYAIYIHEGDTLAADVAGVYRQYLAESGE